MKKDLEIWRFALDRLRIGERVVILFVAVSSGSSPGRAGYKMAVSAEGELSGSIGGGVMEVDLVEQCRALLAENDRPVSPKIIERVHQKNSPNSSGMICSGRQTVIIKELSTDYIPIVSDIITATQNSGGRRLFISSSIFELRQEFGDLSRVTFERLPDSDFIFSERIDAVGRLFIIGSGHCALALSEVMERLGFQISILDDRPELNTIAKNHCADSIRIIETYEKVGDTVPSGEDVYVVVMTLGFASDQEAIRRLVDKDVSYFGVLGSRAKVETMFRELRSEGLDPERLNTIRAPIGIPIASHTPEEIAISIAAEIIAVKNAAPAVYKQLRAKS